MDFLKEKSPRHRPRYSQQAWLRQDKNADPILRRLLERWEIPSSVNRGNIEKDVTIKVTLICLKNVSIRRWSLIFKRTAWNLECCLWNLESCYITWRYLMDQNETRQAWRKITRENLTDGGCTFPQISRTISFRKFLNKKKILNISKKTLKIFQDFSGLSCSSKIWGRGLVVSFRFV